MKRDLNKKIVFVLGLAFILLLSFYYKEQIRVEIVKAKIWLKKRVSFSGLVEDNSCIALYIVGKEVNKLDHKDGMEWNGME
jgi:hypothetical protein